MKESCWHVCPVCDSPFDAYFFNDLLLIRKKKNDVMLPGCDLLVFNFFSRFCNSGDDISCDMKQLWGWLQTWNWTRIFKFHFLRLIESFPTAHYIFPKHIVRTSPFSSLWNLDISGFILYLCNFLWAIGIVSIESLRIYFLIPRIYCFMYESQSSLVTSTLNTS